MKTPYWFLHKTPLAFLLLPLAVLYYLVGRVVYMARRAHTYKSRRPIICVGNILAGGVGKTPIVREIAKFLDAPVVMRGYKKTAHTGNAGDEALMLARDGLQVHTGDRCTNVSLLDNQSDDNGPIVMDDGFQNPTIVKDLSVLVFDESIGCGNGFLLPAGPLREPRGAARRADAIIVIRSRGAKKNFSLPAGVPVFYATNQTVSPYGEDEKIFAFAGIGYPKKFFGALKNVVGKRAFPDHYQYTDEDIAQLIYLATQSGAKLLTTEKDWVRLPAYAQQEIKYARLVTKIDPLFFDWLKEKLECRH